MKGKLEDSGFTLIELIAITGLIVALLAFSFNAFSNKKKNASLNASQKAFQKAVELTYLTAISKEQEVGLFFLRQVSSGREDTHLILAANTGSGIWNVLEGIEWTSFVRIEPLNLENPFFTDFKPSFPTGAKIQYLLSFGRGQKNSSCKLRLNIPESSTFIDLEITPYGDLSLVN